MYTKSRYIAQSGVFYFKELMQPDLLNAKTSPDISEPIFDLNMDDAKIIQSLNHRIEEAKTFFDDKEGYNLTNAREANMRMWLGKHWYKQPMYSYSHRFIDPRIFVATQELVSYLTANVASPEIWPADNSPVAKMLARDIEDWLKADNDAIHLNEKMRSVIYHLLLKRFGMLKLRWDENEGKNGAIVTEAVDPASIVVDQYAALGEEPEFISHTMKASVEELCEKFPDKADAIRSAVGIVRGTTRQMTAMKEYREVWFTWYDNNVRKEAVAWILGSVVMGKMDNPNWNDSGSNLLDMPPKPFIPFNFINDGSSWVDQTTLIEQAWFQQDQLNKRGKQIAEIIDRANGTKVFSSEALGDQDVADLSDHPNQKVVVDAQDVRTAFANVAGIAPDQTMLNDKLDSRQEIDVIMGVSTQATEQSDTLGQDLIIKNKAQGRQDDIVRALETGLDRYYKVKTQMMKVYLTKEHYYSVTKDNAEFDTVAMSKSKIPEGLTIRVQTGTTLPFDKQRGAQIALKLAEMGQIDPISLYEDLDLPDAEKRAKRLMEYKTDPLSYVGGINDDDADRTAWADFISIMDGGTAEPREDIDQKHVEEHTKQMMLPQFLTADPLRKQAFIFHVQQEAALLQQILSAEETQLPTADETDQANMQGDQAAQAQLQPGQPSGGNPEAPMAPEVGASVPPTPNVL